MSFQFFRVGRIVNTLGINGEVKIFLHTDFPKERFKEGNQLLIGAKASPENIKVEVQYSKPYKNMYVLKFKDIDTINEVEKFKDLFLWMPREQQAELNPNEYYYYQIIGCKVITENNEEIGIIKEILSPGANDVWVVKTEENKEILIPYIESVVKEIDVEERRIKINVIEGLID